jgi:hypothetical protein
MLVRQQQQQNKTTRSIQNSLLTLPQLGIIGIQPRNFHIPILLLIFKQGFIILLPKDISTKIPRKATAIKEGWHKEA